MWTLKVLICFKTVVVILFQIFTLSILAFLDRYRTVGSVPYTSVNESLIPYRSVSFRYPVFCGGLFRNKLFRYSLVRSVCTVDMWIGTVRVQVWTHAFSYRFKLYRNSLYRYGTAPDVDRVIFYLLLLFLQCKVPWDAIKGRCIRNKCHYYHCYHSYVGHSMKAVADNYWPVFVLRYVCHFHLYEKNCY